MLSKIKTGLKYAAISIPFLGEYILTEEYPEELRKTQPPRTASIILIGGVSRSLALTSTYLDVLEHDIWYYKPIVYASLTLIEGLALHFTLKAKSKLEDIVSNPSVG